MKKTDGFLKNYLLNKLVHSPKYEFYLNFSDICMDLRPYIEANYYEYINVVYSDINEVVSDNDTVKKLNMLKRDYVNKYVWVRREEMLELLSQECHEINKGYKLSSSKRKFLMDNGFSEQELARIDSEYKEWYILRCFKSVTDKGVINYNRYSSMSNIVGKNMAKYALVTGDYSFTWTSNKKTKRGKSWMSSRLVNDLTVTKNDLEEKNKYAWAKDIVDNRRKRTDLLSGYKWVDLGDMSSNFPNLLNCLKTGVYLDMDYHSKVAMEYGIDRKVAKMAAVRCCFNSKKSDILYGLLDGSDITKLTEEINAIDCSGCMRYDSVNNKIKVNRGYTVDDCHNFFNEHSDNEFFKYCSDFLTSWDACSGAYKNELCPSDLSVYSSAVESCVIKDALDKGVIIKNAYDHAYSINNKSYDWRSSYKKYAEELAPIFNKAKDRDEKKIVEDSHKYVLRSVTKMDNKNSVKGYVRKYLTEKINEYNDMDMALADAAKLFKWSAPLKCYWKKLVKEGEL